MFHRLVATLAAIAGVTLGALLVIART